MKIILSTVLIIAQTETLELLLIKSRASSHNKGCLDCWQCVSAVW